jgi:hypothetical protein
MRLCNVNQIRRDSLLFFLHMQSKLLHLSDGTEVNKRYVLVLTGTWTGCLHIQVRCNNYASFRFSQRFSRSSRFLGYDIASASNKIPTFRGNVVSLCSYLPLKIGVTLLITLEGEGGTKSTLGTRKFNLLRSQVRKRRKIGFNQSLMYMHPLTPTLTPNFFFAPCQLNKQKKSILR